jgi:PncC family amidohydrolase
VTDPLLAADPVPAFHDLVALAARLQDRCVGDGLTVATAESCTGGLVGHAVTEVAGSSGYYLGGFVTYSDAVKTAVLGVPPATLERHGAVSAQTAVAMAEGARGRLGSDIAVAVTGIAGPGGATSDKPVGLTYVAIADRRGHDVRRFLWTYDRTGNKLASARAALELCLDRVTAAPR